MTQWFYQEGGEGDSGDRGHDRRIGGGHHRGASGHDQIGDFTLTMQKKYSREENDWPRELGTKLLIPRKRARRRPVKAAVQVRLTGAIPLVNTSSEDDNDPDLFDAQQISIVQVGKDEWVNPRSLVSGSQITSNSTTRNKIPSTFFPSDPQISQNLPFVFSEEITSSLTRTSDLIPSSTKTKTVISIGDDAVVTSSPVFISPLTTTAVISEPLNNPSISPCAMQPTFHASSITTASNTSPCGTPVLKTSRNHLIKTSDSNGFNQVNEVSKIPRLKHPSFKVGDNKNEEKNKILQNENELVETEKDIRKNERYRMKEGRYTKDNKEEEKLEDINDKISLKTISTSHPESGFFRRRQFGRFVRSRNKVQIPRSMVRKLSPEAEQHVEVVTDDVDHEDDNPEDEKSDEDKGNVKDETDRGKENKYTKYVKEDKDNDKPKNKIDKDIKHVNKDDSIDINDQLEVDKERINDIDDDKVDLNDGKEGRDTVKEVTDDREDTILVKQNTHDDKENINNDKEDMKDDTEGRDSVKEVTNDRENTILVKQNIDDKKEDMDDGKEDLEEHKENIDFVKQNTDSEKEDMDDDKANTDNDKGDTVDDKEVKENESEDRNEDGTDPEHSLEGRIVEGREDSVSRSEYITPVDQFPHNLSFLRKPLDFKLSYETEWRKGIDGGNRIEWRGGMEKNQRNEEISMFELEKEKIRWKEDNLNLAREKEIFEKKKRRWEEDRRRWEEERRRWEEERRRGEKEKEDIYLDLRRLRREKEIYVLETDLRFEELQVEIDRLRTMNIDLIKKVRNMNEEKRNSPLKTKNHISENSKGIVRGSIGSSRSSSDSSTTTESYDPEYMRKIHQLMMRLEDQDNQIIDLKDDNDLLRRQNENLLRKQNHQTLENQLNQLKQRESKWKKSLLGRVGELSGLRSETLEHPWDIRY